MVSNKKWLEAVSPLSDPQPQFDSSRSRSEVLLLPAVLYPVIIRINSNQLVVHSVPHAAIKRLDHGLRQGWRKPVIFTFSPRRHGTRLLHRYFLMIDLTRTITASPDIHTVPTDPGKSWADDVTVIIDAPPDRETEPAPEATWATVDVRTGICGSVTPRVVVLPNGQYRMYYTQMLPRPGFPAGAIDYDHCSTRILSAVSSDGMTWVPEPGVRLSPQQGGAGDFRVVSPDIVPVSGEPGRLRMYYECCPGPQSIDNSIRSAVSDDGLSWAVEPGVRLETLDCHYSSCRIVFLEDGRSRMYVGQADCGIVSAISKDGGVSFEIEDGIRVPMGDVYDKIVAFAPEILQIKSGGYRMYYAGYSASNCAFILTATSDDGFNWTKDMEPVISPGHSQFDKAKCSEIGILPLPTTDGQRPRYRLFYEACDGTAQDERGVWRIIGRTTKKQ